MLKTVACWEEGWRLQKPGGVKCWACLRKYRQGRVAGARVLGCRGAGTEVLGSIFKGLESHRKDFLFFYFVFPRMSWAPRDGGGKEASSEEPGAWWALPFWKGAREEPVQSCGR